MRIALINLSIVCAIPFACEESPFDKAKMTQRLESSLAQLNESDPTQDARKNAQKGDLRYAACLGEAPGPYFPSVPRDQWDQIFIGKDFWMIGGTSDAIESQFHRGLNDRAVAYAGKYNVEILKIKSERKETERSR